MEFMNKREESWNRGHKHVHSHTCLNMSLYEKQKQLFKVDFLPWPHSGKAIWYRQKNGIHEYDRRGLNYVNLAT